MMLPSLAESLKALLQLCISTIHSILAGVFSKVCFWSGGAKRGINSSTASKELDQKREQSAPIPTSVNYHFTRKCNYKCGFCFHTAKTSFVLPLEEAKRGLKLLKEDGKLAILLVLLL